ncbi:MAG: hypothetical protein ACM3SS_01590 [Rhodospirillaceae bacterium]
MIREAMMKKGEEDMPMKEDMPEDEKQETPEHEAAPGDAQEDAAEGEAPDEKAGGSTPEGDPNAMKIILAAMKVLYDKATTGGVEKMLRAGVTPAKGIASTALMVMKLLSSQARGMPPQAIPPAAEAVVLLLGEMAVAMGLEVTPETTQEAQGIVKQVLTQALQGGQPQQQPGLVAGAMQGAQ